MTSIAWECIYGQKVPLNRYFSLEYDSLALGIANAVMCVAVL